MTYAVAVLLTAMFVGCAPMRQPQSTPTTQIPAALIEPPHKQIPVPPDPRASLSPQLLAAIDSPQHPTIHQGITTVFAYSPDQQWTVLCAPLRVTEIRLAPDETVDKKAVDIGDSSRWSAEIGDRTVMVKPLADASDKNMTTNLVIHTNNRSYHLLLNLGRFMPAIEWYYPNDVRMAEAQRQAALRQAAADQLNQPGQARLVCSYRISGDAAWRPHTVCNNGRSVIIGLTDAPGTDAPTLVVANGKEQEVTNYTQDGEWLKTDRLFKRAALVTGVGSQQQRVSIEAQ
jgi:type IV secretion system protein TrbG